MEMLTRELRDAGFLVGEVEELVVKGAAGIFMPHGLGHPVGLEVHDPIPIPSTPCASTTPLRFSSTGPSWPSIPFPNQRPTPFPSPTSLFTGDAAATVLDFQIPRGHVATIEPGVYFIPYLLERVRGDPERARFVGWEKVDGGRYVEVVGGVRIEDVVAVGVGGGVEVFTKLE
ncbi:hypothetical protein HDU67_001633 [Dinochytrium kinnereticum]|nr:hypothetical protein HDU67_001633 [Dinochytrium kinnereticum]